MQQCFLEGNLKDKKQDKAILCHLACIGGIDSFYFQSKIDYVSSIHDFQKNLKKKPITCAWTLSKYQR